jgi:CRISPR-associated endonuclease/helicase Cas3
MYIESWESEIIVTTYVQLMQTLLGVKNRQLKKWHRLRGAIIILDEVQNIPFAYWKLTREICREHSRLFDTKWILLTATQPHIFPKDETYEWLENDTYANRTFFQDMTRTSLHLVSDEFLEIEDWLEQADQLAEGAKSVLIILNTIRTSLEVYRFFREKYGEDVVFYLSANLIPRHRRMVLQQIRERLADHEGKQVVLVSTQVVEAGVDLDFHRVIRDLGPLDSIIQAAGRCNRHNNRETEQVFIIPLCKRSGSRPDSVLVYGTDAICALNVLKKVSSQNPDSIPEARYAELIDPYYREIANMNDDSESTNRLTQLAELSFDALADFNLIRQEVSKYPVFVQFDEEAEELWRFYCEQVVKAEDPTVRRENYLRCKARLKEYQVDISERTLRHHKALREENGMVVVRREWVELGQYYDHKTGMINDPADENAFIM